MARRYDYIPEDVYGSSEDFSDGFQVTGGESPLNDAADDWLSQHDPSLQTERAVNASRDQELNGLSLSGLMEHRVKSMPSGVQSAVKAVMGGQMGTLKSVIASENYLEVTGESPSAFARRLDNRNAPGPVTITDESGTRVESALPYSRTDMRAALGMFSEEGVDRYLSRGVGSAQEGNVYGSVSGEAAYREKLSGAYATIRAIAPTVLSHKMIQGSAAHETALLKAEEELIKFGMEGVYGNYSRMPLPNELRVRGRRSTIGNATGSMGTPFTKFTYGAATSEGGDLYGNEEAWKYQPNPWKSYGYTKENKGQFGEVQEAYVEAIDVIRASTLTTTDEISGNTRRMSGYQQSREDWDARANAMNEATIMGADMFQPGFEGSGMAMPSDREIVDWETGKVKAVPYMIAEGQNLSGSSTGGMYGEKGLSEQNKFVESYRDTRFTEHPGPGIAAYLEKYHDAPTQGSAQWLAQREEVDFTASTIGLLGAKSGMEKVALNMAFKRMKVKEGFTTKGDYTGDTKFIGNTYTLDGNTFEEDVGKFFMARHGKKMGLTMEEAFFERGVGDMSDFGVSPDARLFNKKGEGAGILELKLLQDTTIEGALKKYYDQVQLQLAVTGEETGHLFALDKHTDESILHTISADPKRQEFLINQARTAKQLAASLDGKGAETLLKTVRGRRGATQSGPATQSAKFIPPTGEEETPMEAFNAMTTVGGKSIRVETGLEDEIEGLEDFMRDFGSGGGGGGDDNEDASALREFTKATKNAAKALVSFGSKLDAGAETGFAEMRLATEAGLDTGAVRGMRELFERGGLSRMGIDQTISSAGQTVRNLNRKTTVAKTYGNMITNIKASDLPGVQGVTVPQVGALQQMDAQDLIAWSVTQGEGMTVEERSYFFNEVMNMPALAMNRTVGGGLVGSAYVDLPEAGLLAQKQGDLDVTQKARIFGEASASINRRAGQVQGAAKVVSENLTIHDIVGTAAQGAMVLWNKITGGGDPQNLEKVTGNDANKFPGIFSNGADSSFEGLGDGPVPPKYIDFTLNKDGKGSTQINNVDVKVDVSRDLVKTHAIVNDDEILDEQMNLGTGN